MKSGPNALSESRKNRPRKIQKNPTKNTMEEENNQGEPNPAPAEETTATPQEREERAQETPEQKKPERRVRKNGRNKTGSRPAARDSASEKESCGEVEDLSSFKEKLSGSNVSGYGDGERGGGRRFERGVRRRERAAENAEADAAPSDAAEADAASGEPEASKESAPEGPFFESKKFTPRAVEVPLTDRRPKFSNDKPARDDGVVSYSAKLDCPPPSLFARIKNAIASIFGKKPDSGKKKFRKERRSGDFKGGRRHGGDRKPYNKERRGSGDFKRRHDSDRRQGGRRRRDGESRGREA